MKHLAFLALLSALAGLTRAAVLTPDVDAYIENVLSSWNSPAGAAVAVVQLDPQGGWSVETKGYGVAQANGSKVTPETVFSIGSNSKLFDILATGLLISNTSLEPQISWNTKIASILPGWELADPVATAQSTITDLMSHRTGMPRHDFAYSRTDDVPTLISRMKYLKPSTGFRENPQYSNLMYEFLSYLPTALLPDHPAFTEYVKAHIIDPLGMNATTYSTADAFASGNFADGFTRVDINVTDDPLGRGTVYPLPFPLESSAQGSALSGPGGILSNAIDMATWLQMLLLNGKHPITGEIVVPASAIQTVATGISVWEGNAQFPEVTAQVYGGAQAQYGYRGHVIIEVSHFNSEASDPNLSISTEEISSVRFHAQVSRFPNEGLGIAVLTNDDVFGTYMKEVIKYRIIDEALGLESIDWNTRYRSIVSGARLSAPQALPPPANATLPLPLTKFAAQNYSNPGYGPDIELCAVSQPASPTCSSLVSAINATFPEQLAGADLVWRWDRLSATYAALTHYDGPVFNVSGWVPLQTRNVSVPTIAYDSGLEGVIAQFDIHEGRVRGFGFVGGLWGSGTLEGEPSGKTAEERSEVWYSAV
ncbi:unnamed protein product [Mycena citricolor]|uniref:Beta-lactamase-related domain-containing protein n=1 Tax=Mycena citricolor TaxID=2018698 RepID=A0AAD2HC34_9AGAR|nr:unnamed protein product [Mycena citricolor]